MAHRSSSLPSKPTGLTTRQASDERPVIDRHHHPDALTQKGDGCPILIEGFPCTVWSPALHFQRLAAGRPETGPGLCVRPRRLTTQPPCRQTQPPFRRTRASCRRTRATCRRTRASCRRTRASSRRTRAACRRTQPPCRRTQPSCRRTWCRCCRTFGQLRRAGGHRGPCPPGEGDAGCRPPDALGGGSGERDASGLTGRGRVSFRGEGRAEGGRG